MVDSDTTGDWVVAGRVVRRETIAARSCAARAGDEDGDAKRLRLGWREFDLLRSGGLGFYTGGARVHPGDHHRPPRSSSGEQRCFIAVGANSRRGYLFQSERFEYRVFDPASAGVQSKRLR